MYEMKDTPTEERMQTKSLNELLGDLFLDEDQARSAARYFQEAKNDSALLGRLQRGLDELSTPRTSQWELEEIYQMFMAFLGEEHCRVIDRRRIAAKGQKKTPAQQAAVAKAGRISAARRRGQPRSQATKDRIAETLRTRRAAERALDQTAGD